MSGRGSRYFAALCRPYSRWRRVRRIVLDRDGWRCRKCGKAGRLEVDHIVPLEAGGEPFELDNLRALCRDCHIRRHRRAPRDPERAKWRNMVAAMLKG